MLLRRSLPVAALLAAVACAPAVPYESPPASIGYAVFDSTNSIIPLPNDLALQQSTIDKYPNNAQKDLLLSWKTAGGFPNDQKVSITIPFQVVKIDEATGNKTTEAPDLDVSSVNPTTIVLIKSLGGAVTPAAYGAVSAADYVKTTAKGADGSNIAVGWLTLNNVKSASGAGPLPWDAGATYIVGVRGGPNGVKLAGGAQVNPSPTFYFLLQGKNMRDPNNQTLIPCDEALATPCSAQRAAAGEQLETLRGLYVTPFAAVSAAFPSKELAVLSTFKVAPATTPYVYTDPDRGLVPLPVDLLLTGPATNADGTLNKGLKVQSVASFGPLAPGLATLDGFTTSGMLLAQVSGPILASSVNKDTVFLYDLTNPSAPVRVPEAKEAGCAGAFQAEPDAITQVVGGAAVSTAIGLQPAVPAATGIDTCPVLPLPPLKEATTYAVLITNKVKAFPEVTKGISRSTMANLLLFDETKPVEAGGKSLLSGVPDSSAAVLEGMRRLLHKAIAQAKTDGKIAGRDDLAMAYTFRTQTITGKAALTDSTAPIGALQLAALPYKSPALTLAMNPTFKKADGVTDDPTLGIYTPAEAWKKWGLDTAAAPNDAIQEVIHVATMTPNLLSAATGAFDPTGAVTMERINLLIAVPKYAAAAACPGALGAPAGAHCAPLVVFHHGLGGSKSAMLNVANAYAAQGMVVVSFDGAKHGDRSWCSADSQCNGGAAGSCVTIAGSATQGDAKAPGICSTGNLKAPTNCSTAQCVVDWATWNATSTHPGDVADGYARNSSNYFTSANFFRTRDTIRQDLIDAAAVILTLSRPPASASVPALPAPGNAIQNRLGAQGLVINPVGALGGGVFWVGQSLGAILGTSSLAANSRLTKGVLNVGGGTLVDILTNAPSFTSSIDALLGSVGIVRGTAGYLQFINVAKWVLDPADPINLSRSILGTAFGRPTLPDLLAGGAAQADKKVLGQLAACDLTVPNAFNVNLYGNIGLGVPNVTVASLFVNPYNPDVGGACPLGVAATSPGSVPHSFVTSRGVIIDNPASPPAYAAHIDTKIQSLANQAASQAAAFLMSNTLPPTTVVPAP